MIQKPANDKLAVPRGADTVALGVHSSKAVAGGTGATG